MTTYCGVEIDVEGPLPVSPLQFGLCHHLVQLMDVEVKGDSQLFCLIQAGLGEGQFEEEVLQCASEGRREGGGREEGGREGKTSARWTGDTTFTMIIIRNANIHAIQMDSTVP